MPAGIRKFKWVSLLFAVLGVILVVSLVLTQKTLSPYGYQNAPIESMQAKLVQVIGKGRYARPYTEAQYLFRNVHTGKLVKLHDLFTKTSQLRVSAQVVELSFIKDQLLECHVDGVAQCSPQCFSASQCEARRIAMRMRERHELGVMLVVWLVGWALVYWWKVWRLRRSWEEQD